MITVDYDYIFRMVLQDQGIKSKELDLERCISGLTQIKELISEAMEDCDKMDLPYNNRAWDNHHEQCWEDESNCDIHYVEEYLGVVQY